MQQRLASLSARLADAAGRRGRGGRAAGPAQDWAARLDAVVDVLRRDHGKPGRGDPVDVGETRLQALAAVYGLTPVDLDLLTVAAAPELDPNMGVAFGLLRGQPEQTRATVALAMELSGLPSLDASGRERLAPFAPLRRHGLLQVEGEQALPWRALRVPDRLAAHLLGVDSPDPVVAAMLVEAVPEEFPETPAVARALRAGMPLVWVRSGAGTAGLAFAAGALDAIGVPHVAVDVSRWPEDHPLAPALAAAALEAGIELAGLVVLGAEVVAARGGPRLLQWLERVPVPVLAVADCGWDPGWLRRLPLVVDAPAVDPARREQLWREQLGALADDDAHSWRDLVSLRLSPEEIAQVAHHAHDLASSHGAPLALDTVREATRRLGGHATGGTKRTRTRARFDDLVLDDGALGSLRQLVDWAQHRDEVLSQGPLTGKGGKGSGITALFAGAPGTGKTLAAHVVAASLGLELYTVELTTVVDKYIGETEKNLEKAFREAENLNVVLFFDEADSLFGARSEVRDSRDRYANLEVAYLLQRMEQFDGIVILATNLRGNLDPAFSRRLHFIVHFSEPDADTRRRLWEHHLRHVSRLDPDDPVDVDALAASLEVTGGDIRNIVLAAAYGAAIDGSPVGMRHVLSGTVREYGKLGRRMPDVAPPVRRASGAHPEKPLPDAPGARTVPPIRRPGDGVRHGQ